MSGAFNVRMPRLLIMASQSWPLSQTFEIALECQSSIVLLNLDPQFPIRRDPMVKVHLAHAYKWGLLSYLFFHFSPSVIFELKKTLLKFLIFPCPFFLFFHILALKGGSAVFSRCHKEVSSLLYPMSRGNPRIFQQRKLCRWGRLSGRL